MVVDTLLFCEANQVLIAVLTSLERLSIFSMGGLFTHLKHFMQMQQLQTFPPEFSPESF